MSLEAEVTVEAPEPVFEALTLLDRCDQCSAAGMVRVYKAGRSLVFCGHHYDDHVVALSFDGWDLFEDLRVATP